METKSWIHEFWWKDLTSPANLTEYTLMHKSSLEQKQRYFHIPRFIKTSTTPEYNQR